MKKALSITGVVLLILAAGFVYRKTAEAKDPKEWIGQGIDCGEYILHTCTTGGRTEGCPAVVAIS